MPARAARVTAGMVPRANRRPRPEPGGRSIDTRGARPYKPPRTRTADPGEVLDHGLAFGGERHAWSPRRLRRPPRAAAGAAEPAARDCARRRSAAGAGRRAGRRGRAARRLPAAGAADPGGQLFSVPRAGRGHPAGAAAAGHRGRRLRRAAQWPPRRSGRTPGPVWSTGASPTPTRGCGCRRRTRTRRCPASRSTSCGAGSTRGPPGIGTGRSSRSFVRRSRRWRLPPGRASRSISSSSPASRPRGWPRPPRRTGGRWPAAPRST